MTSETVDSSPTPTRKSSQIDVRNKKSLSKFFSKATARGVIRRKLKKNFDISLKLATTTLEHQVTRLY